LTNEPLVLSFLTMRRQVIRCQKWDLSLHRRYRRIIFLWSSDKSRKHRSTYLLPSKLYARFYEQRKPLVSSSFEWSTVSYNIKHNFFKHNNQAPSDWIQNGEIPQYGTWYKIPINCYFYEQHNHGPCGRDQVFRIPLDASSFCIGMFRARASRASASILICGLWKFQVS